MLDHSRLFHIGVRVPDLETAMAEISTVGGLTLASVQDRSMSAWVPGAGHADLQLALTYSVEGPVHVELLGSVEAIAAAKTEIIDGLRPDGTAVVPAASKPPIRTKCAPSRTAGPRCRTVAAR